MFVPRTTTPRSRSRSSALLRKHTGFLPKKKGSAKEEGSQLGLRNEFGKCLDGLMGADWEAQKRRSFVEVAKKGLCSTSKYQSGASILRCAMTDSLVRISRGEVRKRSVFRAIMAKLLRTSENSACASIQRVFDSIIWRISNIYFRANSAT